MPGPETTFGGPARAFPETTWGMVRRVAVPDPAERRAGLETLCRRYWKPVYSFCRAAWSRTNEEAKDLTQDFFTWLFEEDVLSRYVPDCGGFRAYLKGLLRNFSGNQFQAARRLKRGGAAGRIAITDEMVATLADSRSTDPEQDFDRMWMAEVIRTATERARDGSVAWRAFEAYDLAAERPTYADVAQKLGIKESDVRNHLFSIRTKVREFIREELRDTVETEEEAREEWNAFFGP